MSLVVRTVRKGVVETVRKEKIDYPSNENPRIEGLTEDNPKIIELAKSIKRNGLLVRPILYQKEDGRYDAIDGDRRLISIFDILGWEEVDADIIEMPEKAERYVLRMIANDDRQDFTSLERGAYIYVIIEDDMAKDDLEIEACWSYRETRNEYLRRASDKLGKPVSSISRYISLWLKIPAEDRTLIARNREELRLENKLSPSKAFKILTIGRKLGNLEAVWRIYVPKDAVKTKKHLNIVSSELEITRRAISSGQIMTVERLREFLREGEAEEWSQLTLFVKKAEEREASKLAAKFSTEISKVYRASILLGTVHPEELGEIIKEGL